MSAAGDMPTFSAQQLRHCSWQGRCIAVFLGTGSGGREACRDCLPACRLDSSGTTLPPVKAESSWCRVGEGVAGACCRRPAYCLRGAHSRIEEEAPAPPRRTTSPAKNPWPAIMAEQGLDNEATLLHRLQNGGASGSSSSGDSPPSGPPHANGRAPPSPRSTRREQHHRSKLLDGFSPSDAA